MKLLDFHTHRIDSRDGIISMSPREAETFTATHDTAIISVSIHPWDTSEEPDMALLERIASLPQTVAIGEAGLDKTRGASLERQTEIFRRQTELSEQTRKPMIIHCVRAWDELLAIKKETRPRQKWGIHGYRGGAELARQLISHGFYISLGEHFNPAAAGSIPADRLLAETDESHLTIEEIAYRISLYAAPGGNAARSIREFLK